MHTPAPVHIGHQPPGSPDYLPLQNPAGRDFGEQVRMSALNKVEIDWSKHEIEPRWLGSESAACVAALQPGWFHNQGAPERDRYFDGAAERNETALVISMLGFAHDTKPIGFMSSGGGDSVNLAMTMSVVHGRRLPTRTAVRLATGLTRADEDLGKRLLNRPADAPWWSLKLSKLATEPGMGRPQDHEPVGELRPILVDPLGDPVVGVWLAPHEQIRWYIVPDKLEWNGVLDWLIHQAIPTYVPAAAQRYRSSSFVDTSLLTPAESRGQQALSDMESRHAEERARLEAALADARQAAEPLRDGLFYGTGDTLVDAVATVLRATTSDATSRPGPTCDPNFPSVVASSSSTINIDFPQPTGPPPSIADSSSSPRSPNRSSPYGICSTGGAPRTGPRFSAPCWAPIPRPPNRTHHPPRRPPSGTHPAKKCQHRRNVGGSGAAASTEFAASTLVQGDRGVSTKPPVVRVTSTNAGGRPQHLVQHERPTAECSHAART